MKYLNSKINIFSSILKKVNLFSSDERSLKYHRNTIVLVLSQFFSVLSSFFLVPLVLKYLGVEEYGVWITLSTIIAWLSFFDIGLGNGLRNKYAEAKALNKLEDINIYVSTTFYILSILSASIFFLVLFLDQFINWSSILAAPTYLEQEIRILVIFVIGTFCVRFVLNLVSILLIADQEPAIVAILNLASNLFSLIGAYIFGELGWTSLLNFGICLSISQFLPFLLAFCIYFSNKYKNIIPRLKYFKKDSINIIFSLGIKYFLIQITGLVLFQTNNVIIAHMCSMKDVTIFNISYKYMNIIYILFITVLSPLWSASTDAYVKNDLIWIKRWMKRLMSFWWLMIFLGLIMVILSPFVFKFWLNNEVENDYILLLLLLVYFGSLTRTSMYRYFMNGIGKIKLQFYVTTFQAILHLPTAFFLGKLFGMYGILISMIIWNVSNIIWEPLQYNRLINNTAKGIWAS